jgi:lysophospholipase L1-like esterase
MRRLIQAFTCLAILAISLECLAQPQAPPMPTTQPGADGQRQGFGGGQGFGGQGGQPGLGGGRGGRGGRGGGRGPAGPPAPVPPEVAIPRPTTAELAQINDAVKRFIDSDNSSAKPVLEKYRSLLVVQPPRANSAIAPTPRQQQRHDAFVERAKQGDIDLLLIGDSITDWWTRNNTPTAAYTKYFGNIKTANFAIAGDTTQGVLWGLQNGEGEGFQPKAIMMMIGTNNGQNTAEEVAEGIGAIVLECRKRFPNAKILLLGIFPRDGAGDAVRTKIANVNKIIAKLDDNKNVFYMDIGAKFLGANGEFLPDTFPDRLHPNEAGYEIWGAAVKDKLAELMK